MKKIISIIVFSILLFTFQFSVSQTTAIYRYQIRFTDKNNNPFSISLPQEYLSQKAIDRREKQHLLIDSLDLPVTPAYIDSVKNTGVIVLYSSKWLNSVTIFTTDSLALVHINSFSFVKSIKAVGKILPHQNNSPQYFNSSLRTECGIDNYYGFAFDQIKQVHGQALHEKGFKGQGMLIAYLDAGFQHVDLIPAFDSLRKRNGIIATHDFITGGDSVYEDNSHGAYCLSIVAGNEPGYYVGTAPNADFVLIRTEYASTEFPIEEINWAAGAEFADSIGADVITSSLGYSTFDTVFSGGNTIIFDHTFLDMDGKTNPSSIAANIASTRGLIVCNSAGNSGGESSWRFITAPSDADNILTVGAIDSSNNYALFSGHGPTFDGRIKPDVVGRGVSTWYINTSYGSASEGNGTSFSCPLIAGLTACLWEAHPDKSNLEIMNAIRRSASKYFRPDNNIGYGIPNFAYADLLLSGFNEQSLLSLDSIIVYPTIFSGEIKINLKLNVAEEISIQLFDLSGRLVDEECANAYIGFNELSFQPANLTAGVYMLKVIAGNKIHYEKLVKI
ncbi:serine protease [Bacteroidota bacterium]|nr:serine protease [Bacteroidota bacterium]